MTPLFLYRPCKTRKVKWCVPRPCKWSYILLIRYSGEEKPSCLNCQRQGEPCDYSVRLNWEGRPKRKTALQSSTSSTFSLLPTPSADLTGVQNSPSSFGLLDDAGVAPRSSSLPPKPRPHGHQASDNTIWTPPQMSSDMFTRYSQSVQQQPLGVVSYPPSVESGSSVGSPVSLMTAQPVSQSLSTPHSRNPFYQPTSVPVSSVSSLSSPGQDASTCSPREGGVIRMIPKSPPDGTAAREMSTAEGRWHAYLTTVSDNYGLDCGRIDLDLNRNNDHAAIDVNYALDLISSSWKTDSRSVDDYRRDLQEQNPHHSDSGYYAVPVPINIPRYLSPLPASLVKNPINLMYFHHFLNHTARMLVPHDCADNPFISVMPSSKCHAMWFRAEF